MTKNLQPQLSWFEYESTNVFRHPKKHLSNLLFLKVLSSTEDHQNHQLGQNEKLTKEEESC